MNLFFKVKIKSVKVINKALSLFGLRLSIKCDNGVFSTFEMADALDRIRHHVPNLNGVIDLGASNGIWSVNCMNVFNTAQFLAVEPLLERKDALEQLKVKYNNFDYADCVAGGQDKKEVEFSVSDDLDGSALTNSGEGNLRKCMMRTVDSLLDERSMKGPYLLKFDTHGFEVPILLGCEKTLENTEVILMEVYNYRIVEGSLLFYEMCQLLDDKGFRPVDIADPMLRIRDNTLWQMDLLFVRKENPVFTHNQYR